MDQKTYYQKKYIDCKALDVDTKTRKVKIAIAELETIDKDGDLIHPTAMDKSIKERGPAGTNEIWHLLDHTRTSFSALSRFEELGRQGKYIVGVSAFKNSFAWREVAWPLYESGDFTQHSIGYMPMDQMPNAAGYNDLKEIYLMEGSAVLWGANPNTPTLAIQKSLGISEKDDVISQLERLTKAIKLGKHEDESHRELIVLEIKRIQQHIFDLLQKSTEPGANLIQPNDEDLNVLIIANANIKTYLSLLTN